MAEVLTGRSVGVIRCYYPLKGYGFIRRLKGKDVFFYRSDASGEEMLFDGAQVSFILQEENKGPRAFEIERIG
ncbi:retron Se72 family effector protein [Paucibacter sediminis]|uniref:Retron Se72 family effector protein n=1 Tax=Paucibacter sediminis TaxID=3019553 RepID=A0AA95SQQ2_9BURK|nr:retron Se72 family effector protein [Paucibacter sp. S2-9]WIT12246.1 retron Se72 family effector protein [Paucibacter sp. S2-9]